jgi:transposase
VAHEVTNVGHDHSQLSKTGNRRKTRPATMRSPSLPYSKGEDILTCEQAGMTPYVANQRTSGAKAEGRFGKQDPDYALPSVTKERFR